jgi:hypothetical protein
MNLLNLNGSLELPGSHVPVLTSRFVFRFRFAFELLGS